MQGLAGIEATHESEVEVQGVVDSALERKAGLNDE